MNGTMAETNYQQWYGLLRDAIMEHLNPQDGEEAEVDILVRAIEDAGNQLDEDDESVFPHCRECGNEFRPEEMFTKQLCFKCAMCHKMPDVPQDAIGIRPFRTHSDELYLYEAVTWDSNQWSQCELWLRRLNNTGQLCKESVGYGLDLLDTGGYSRHVLCDTPRFHLPTQPLALSEVARYGCRALAPATVG